MFTDHEKTNKQWAPKQDVVVSAQYESHGSQRDDDQSDTCARQCRVLGHRNELIKFPPPSFEHTIYCMAQYFHFTCYLWNMKEFKTCTNAPRKKLQFIRFTTIGSVRRCPFFSTYHVERERKKCGGTIVEKHAKCGRGGSRPTWYLEKICFRDNRHQGIEKSQEWQYLPGDIFRDIGSNCFARDKSGDSILLR